MIGPASSRAHCGARTRKGTACIAPTQVNGRCRMHGGLSTGPKTENGRRRIADAVRKRWETFRTIRDRSAQAMSKILGQNCMEKNMTTIEKLIEALAEWDGREIPTLTAIAREIAAA